jgi:prepilin-type N-terminal cleavage/methylation domain-containing protein
VRRTERRPGFTLIELLLVMAAMGILGAVGAATLASLLRVERSADEAARRRADRAALADHFRADVAAADAAPGRVDEVAAGPNCLLLRRPDGTVVAYRAEAGQVRRSEGETPDEGRVLFEAADTTVEFTRNGPSLWTLALTEQGRKGAVPRRTEITASLGGDLR